MRIPNIPRRDWQDGIGELQDQLTEALKLPGAPADLRLLPIQAAILYDLYVNSKAHTGRGCLGAARVGAGKTLCAALAGSVIGADSVLVLCPGGIKASTMAEIERYRPHWRLPPNLSVRSYSWLSRAENAEYLLRSRPQLVVFDESHHLKNRLGSSIAKRVWRLRKEDPTCVFLPLTGSILRDSITDFSHVLTWTLGEGAPVPLDETDVKTWATVLDGPGRTKSPGSPDRDLNLGPALAEFSTQIGVSCRSVDDARAAFNDRLIATPGVVVSSDHFTDVPLTVYGTELTPPEGPVAEAMERLKTYEEAPDGYPMAAGLGAQIKSMEEQLCLGFCYLLDPWPPEDWRNARSAWCKFVRDCTQDEWADEDTELQVKRAVLGGALPQGRGLLAEWLRLEPTYDIESHRQVRWLSDHALKAAEEWGRANGRGIIWTPYQAFGHALAERTGWAYFRQGAKDAKRRRLDDRDAVKDDVVIASVKSCGTGLNCQYQWHKNLWVVPMNSSLDAEQCLDSETQVLTPEGWKGINDEFTEVASFNPATEEVQWRRPSARIRRPLGAESMWGIEGRHNNIRVTAGHRMVVRKGRRAGATAPCIWDSTWSFEHADSLPSRVKYPVAGHQDAPGSGLQDFELWFIGFWLADGHRSKTVVELFQSERYQRVCRKIDDVLTQMDIYFAAGVMERERTNFGRVKHRLFRWRIPKHKGGGWAKYETYLDKEMSAPEFQRLTRQELLWLLEGLWDGDGTKAETAPHTLETKQIAMRPSAADQLQSLCVRRGIRCWVSPVAGKKVTMLGYSEDKTQWHLQRNGGSGRALWQELPSDPREEVWCVTVPEGAIITRRRGKVAIVGNCAARTHRLGQTQPVTVEYWYGCKANLKSFRKSVYLAEKTEALLAQTPKLSHCDLTAPAAPSNPDHPAWK